MAESLAIPLTQLWHSLVLGLVVVLGWNDPGLALSAVIELGSSSAVIAYFRREGRGRAGAEAG